MEALTTLLDSGTAVTLTNSITGYTALHEAAAFGNREIVEHLLKNAKADANASDYKAVTPLMLASGSGYSIICEYLLQYGALVDSCSAEEMTALHFASANGDPRVAQQIIEAGKLPATPVVLRRKYSLFCSGRFNMPSFLWFPPREHKSLLSPFNAIGYRQTILSGAKINPSRGGGGGGWGGVHSALWISKCSLFIGALVAPSS